MLRMLWSGKDEIQHIVYVLLFVWALRRGGKVEQVSAGLLLAMPVCDDLYHYFANGSLRWHNADMGHLVVDCVMLAATGVLALQANRIYPLWIGAAQIISVLAHLYRLLIVQIDRVVYDIMSMLPSYIQLVALVIGLLCHVSRHRKLGSYPSWRSSFQLSRASRTASLQSA